MSTTSNRQIVSDSFAGWAAGTGHVSSIFAPDMRWEIVGLSDVSRKYDSAQQFTNEVLAPFNARFSREDPFRPVSIRGVYADDEENMVAVVWDGKGTTVDGSAYVNTYAWFLRLEDGLVVEGTAFYDSVAFNELWRNVSPP